MKAAAPDVAPPGRGGLLRPGALDVAHTFAAIDPANEPLALLHFAFRAVVQEADALLAHRGLGRVHHRILFFVARFPGCTVGELHTTLGISKQALHGPLQALLRAKLAVTRQDEQNRRLRRVTLTEAGTALEARLSGGQRALFERVFRHAGPRAAAGWREVMCALAAGLQGVGRGAAAASPPARPSSGTSSDSGRGRDGPPGRARTRAPRSR